MENPEVAAVLYEIADILEIQGVEFKPRAYRNAARSLESLSRDINDVHKEGRLEELPAIGKAIAEKIAELLETGHLRYLEQLKKSMPMDVEGLLAVPGIGPKKVSLLHKKLGIRTVADLEGAARKGLIRTLAGMGEKTEQDLLQSIEFVKKSGERKTLGEALPFAEAIVTQLKKANAADSLVVAGSLRRRKETIGDIDILATSSEPERLVKSFVELKQVEQVLARGSTKASVRMSNGLQVDVRIVEKGGFGSALNYFTGSKEHNIALRKIAIEKRLKLSEYGLLDAKERIVAAKTEEEIYRRLGLEYIEPELRENRGEIEAARERKLPRLIGYDDIKGDLQVHTTWSDGLASVEEMAAEAAKLGYEYIGITDHAGSLRIANSLDAKRIEEQRKEISSLKAGLRIFHGLEANIREDGSLDVNDAVLKKVDFVIASIHSGFKNTKEKMTSRICKAMENPLVTMIAHPTGRIINERKSYDLDIDLVLDKAKETDTYLEINAHPSRLDLNDVHSRAAVSRGLRLLVNTDAHSLQNLRDMSFGIATARRGWCKKKDILNTLPLRAFEKEFFR